MVVQLRAVGVIALLSAGLGSSWMHAQTGTLRVAIVVRSVAPTYPEFELATVLTNTDKSPRILHLSQCSDSAMQWVADSPLVEVESIPCKKNRVFDVTLEPGASRRSVIHVGTKTPGRPGWPSVVVRLGFVDRPGAVGAGKALSTGMSSTIIWSNAVTLQPGK